VLENNKSYPWLKKVARASAWLLLVGIIVLLVSGWGITQTGIIYRLTGGLVDRRLADAVHRATIVPLTFLFLLHVMLNIRLKVSSKNTFKVWLTNAVLIIIGAGLMAITVYMEYFRLGG
jgi:succinate dehydrogenase/fumarate reductase cytochrome b subunit